MASIIKRNKTYCVVYYEGEGKNRQQKWESGLTYSAARARKATIEYELEHNIHVPTTDLTVGEFLYEFIDKYGEKKWVASTYSSNVALLENYVFPYWGEKKLRNIRTKTVDDFYDYLLKEAEPVANPGGKPKKHPTSRTVIALHRLLRCAFNRAVKWEYIGKNPFLNATPPEHKEKQRAALTPEQLCKVLDFTDRPEIYDYFVIHCAIQLSFACCLRGGEIGGAQWSRYDPEQQSLIIDRVIDRVDKTLLEKLSKMDIKQVFPNLLPGTRTVIVLKQPKTDGSVRTVYLPETVANKLQTLKEFQEKQKADLGEDCYSDYDLIIAQSNGRPVMTEQLNKWFKSILEAMDDPDIDPEEYVFHSIRHTSTGVKLRMSHGDLKAVQGDGGWSSPEMITRRYAHIIDEDRRRLAQAMETEYYKGQGFSSGSQIPTDSAAQIISLLANDPSLLTKLLASLQSAIST